MRPPKNEFWLKCLKDLNEMYARPLGRVCAISVIDLVQLIGLWSLILKSETSFEKFIRHPKRMLQKQMKLQLIHAKNIILIRSFVVFSFLS